jgi:hypothetical protein
MIEIERDGPNVPLIVAIPFHAYNLSWHTVTMTLILRSWIQLQTKKEKIKKLNR